MVLHHNHWWWAKNELFCLCILDLTVWVTMDGCLNSFSSVIGWTGKTSGSSIVSGGFSANFQWGSNLTTMLYIFMCWKLELESCDCVVGYYIYQAMNACPKANIPNFKDKLHEENLYLITEVIGALSNIYMVFDMGIMFLIWSMIGRRARAVTRVDFKHEGKQYPEKACCCFSAQYKQKQRVVTTIAWGT